MNPAAVRFERAFDVTEPSSALSTRVLSLHSTVSQTRAPDSSLPVFAVRTHRLGRDRRTHAGTEGEQLCAICTLLTYVYAVSHPLVEYGSTDRGHRRVAR